MNLRYQRPATLGTTVNLFANGRYDFNSPAFRSQQFEATGPNGISGLLPGSILGDYGFSSRAELGRPVNPARLGAVVTPHAYVAAVETYLRSPTAVEFRRTSDEEAGVSVSVDFLMPFTREGAWQARLEWFETQSNDSRFDRLRVRASLAYRFWISLAALLFVSRMPPRQSNGDIDTHQRPERTELTEFIRSTPPSPVNAPPASEAR